ncbi:uncharacterized protein DS421_3g81190 [Arachis hypogaea]|nr:uncharacterized protein DS421_3g81190 [Arachis hypogaea]
MHKMGDTLRKQSAATASERDDAYAASSRSSVWLCSCITRSVVTTVLSLQSGVRHLTDTFYRQNEMLADLQRTIFSLICQNNQGFTLKGITNVSSGCVCSGKKRLKEQHSDKYKSKKRVTPTPTCSMDGKNDPTYIPLMKTEFSMDHMPFRSTRAKKKTRTKKPELVDLTRDSVGHDEFATPYG